MARKKATGQMIREKAQEIWLAGLGAWAMAGEEGEKLYESLVKKGATVEKKGKVTLSQAMEQARSVKADAESALGRAVAPIDAGVTNVLHKLGVPTRKEIQTLTRRVEELTRTVERKGAARVRRAPVRRRAKAAAQ